MITERLKLFLESLFSSKRNTVESKFTDNSMLELRLERNAIEQVKFAQWLYGDGFLKCKSNVKKLLLAEDPKAYFQFDYSNNVFSLNKPSSIETDEFYYLFDYLKELYGEYHYKVIEAVKESKTEELLYTEVERYVLVNNKTNHLIKLEIINDHKGHLYIQGLGYPVDGACSSLNEPIFFRVIKETF